ncbi:MAG: hypothetical protein HY566_01060 [Candidatus Kerfeldbacteria bacterium]|nr:hypothetical protein [Candidatus Kerfeldbacteria bacterium]
MHPKKVRTVIRRLRTPRDVQKWIYTLKYNPSDTLRTLDGVVRTNKAHCLEAVIAAATILEYHGYPPLILDLESADYLDHTLFFYRHNGKYGTVGMSRDVGLYGRKPMYPNIRSLALSYAAPYIDHHAALMGYGVLDLRTLKHDGWRLSSKNVWYIERVLRKIPHRRLSVSSAYVRQWRHRYIEFKKQHPRMQPHFYPNQRHWS